MTMPAAEIRARRVGLGLSQGDVARLMGVEDRTVRRWEAGDAEAPAELQEQYAALREQRDEIARAWIVAGSISIPAAPDGPVSLWWAAAARALELQDLSISVESPARPTDGRRTRARGTLSAVQVSAARALRDAGRSWRAIGAELGVDESTVRRALGPDGARTGPPSVVAADEVLRLHRIGMTQAGIAAQLGVSRGAVRRRLAEAGAISWPAGLRRTAGT
jgi:transcriptional regulator with XRE-family HTH domain